MAKAAPLLPRVATQVPPPQPNPTLQTSHAHPRHLRAKKTCRATSHCRPRPMYLPTAQRRQQPQADQTSFPHSRPHHLLSPLALPCSDQLAGRSSRGWREQALSWTLHIRWVCSWTPFWREQHVTLVKDSTPAMAPHPFVLTHPTLAAAPLPKHQLMAVSTCPRPRAPQRNRTCATPHPCSPREAPAAVTRSIPRICMCG